MTDTPTPKKPTPRKQTLRQPLGKRTVINPLAREILKEIQLKEDIAFETFKEETSPTKRFAAGICVQVMKGMREVVLAAMETIDRRPAP